MTSFGANGANSTSQISLNENLIIKCATSLSIASRSTVNAPSPRQSGQRPATGIKIASLAVAGGVRSAVIWQGYWDKVAACKVCRRAVTALVITIAEPLQPDDMLYSIISHTPGFSSVRVLTEIMPSSPCVIAESFFHIHGKVFILKVNR